MVFVMKEKKSDIMGGGYETVNVGLIHRSFFFQIWHLHALLSRNTAKHCKKSENYEQNIHLFKNFFAGHC